MTSISYIIPSINRASLKRTIDSIEALEGDEILVEYDIPRTRMWGNPQRNKAMTRAKGEYLAFIDDDDYYVPGHRQIQEEAIQAHPNRPILFQMQYPSGDVLWKTKEVIPGNVGTPMILVPNFRDMLYHWKDGRNMADFIFIDKWGWEKDQIIWVDKVIAILGGEDGKAILHE